MIIYNTRSLPVEAYEGTGYQHAANYCSQRQMCLASSWDLKGSVE